MIRVRGRCLHASSDELGRGAPGSGGSVIFKPFLFHCIERPLRVARPRFWVRAVPPYEVNDGGGCSGVVMLVVLVRQGVPPVLGQGCRAAGMRLRVSSCSCAHLCLFMGLV